MLQDQIRSGGNRQQGLLHVDRGERYFVDEQGNLTDMFRAELQLLSQEQLAVIEQKIVDVKPPGADCFGIKRRNCNVCETDCPGYESSNFLFASSTQKRGEFPTFCKECYCPAYFHKIEPNQFNFPDNLKEYLTSNNIQTQDINWNCLMTVFKLERGSISRINDIIESFKSAGLEVISFSQRFIKIEEAFLLRSRIVDMQYENLLEYLNQNYKPVNQDNEIMNSINLNALTTSTTGEQNPYLLEQQTQKKEEIMKKMMNSKKNNNNNSQGQSLNATPKSQNNTNNPLKQKLIQNLTSLLPPTQKALASIPEEDEDFERASVQQIQIDGGQINKAYQDYLIRRKLLPSVSEVNLQQKMSLTNNKAKVSKIMTQEDDEKDQIDFLVQQFESNALMQDLCQKEIVFLIVSSNSVKDISSAVKKIVSRDNLDNLKGTKLMYYSQNKIAALEDCIEFVPHLFRLSKSIIVSEPLFQFSSHQFHDDSYLGKIIQRDEKQAHNNKDDHVFRNNKSLATHYSDRNDFSMKSMLSTINKQQQHKRKVAMSNQDVADNQERRNSMDSDNLSQQSWVIRAKQSAKLKGNYKQSRLEKLNNKILFNYGVMRDFFNYSGMSVQVSHKEADFARPIKPYGIRGALQIDQESKLAMNQPCNMFALAKVGVPNLIMPNTLDLKFQNFENFDNYTQVADMYFPELGINHQTVIILRPILVRNKLNDLMLSILRANEFIVLSRKIRPLTAGETAYLFQAEAIPESNKELYFDIMMAGPCEIIVVSKLAAVYDAQTLLYGAAPFGRRRLAQPDETMQGNNRSNVDSVSSMFEIAPFTSISELLDLEDFLTRNSKLNKFKKANAGQTPGPYLVQQDSQMRKEIMIFSRFFNFAGYCSKSIQLAKNDICTFAPQIANIEEVILILNPIYNDLIADSFELLVRMGFNILKHKQIQFRNESDIIRIFGEKIDMTSQDGKIFISQMTCDECHVFHLMKTAGDKEVRQLFINSGIDIGDILTTQEFGSPIKPVYLPLVFLFLDTSDTFEQGLKLIYKPENVVFSGRQLDLYNEKTDIILVQILQLCLLVTLGDTVKAMYFDGAGRKKALKNTRKTLFEPINTLQYSAVGSKVEYMYKKNLQDEIEKQRHISFAVESNEHGIFNVRILNLVRDIHSGQSEDVVQQYQLQQEKALTEQFASLSLFYRQASQVTSNGVPSFYKYKIGGNLCRVYEVEEYMGDKFMIALCKLHLQQQMINQMNPVLVQIEQFNQAKTKSLPAYLFGVKIAQLCRSLENIKTKVKGAGRFIFSESNNEEELLIGELARVTESSYYFYDKQRYLGYLEKFKKGWGYFLSVLESDVIEMKLQIILNSLTYRYSRQPQFLKLVPERLTSEHLRISEKLKVVNPNVNQDKEKFFKSDGWGLIQPNKEVEMASKVESVMQTIKDYHKNNLKKIQDKLDPNKLKTNIRGVIGKPSGLQETVDLKKHDQEYSIHNDVGICGFQDGIARRPQFHLFASILWILKFEYTKVNRLSSHLIDYQNTISRSKVEEEYDELIQIVLNSAKQEYLLPEEVVDEEKIIKEELERIKIKQQTGKEPPVDPQKKKPMKLKERAEAVDVLKLQENEADKSEIQKHMEGKERMEQKMLAKIQQELEETKRKKRTTMTIPELIESEVYAAADEAKKKQREELKQFLSIKGGMDRDGTEFMNFLDKSKMQFGPFAEKLAEKFAEKQALKQKLFTNQKVQQQEFISLIMMEYFLYGVSEANYLIDKLKEMETKIGVMNDEYDETVQKIDETADKLRRLPQDRSLFEQRLNLQNQVSKLQKQKAELSDLIYAFRLEISTKEGDLLSVFKEIMSCDFYVSDDYFNKNQNDLIGFKIPLETFWRPVEIPEIIEKNLNNEKYQKQVGAMTSLTTNNYGKFMSAHLREQLLKDQATLQKIEVLNKGSSVSNLNDPKIKEKPKDVPFDSLEPPSIASQQNMLNKLAENLKGKGRKEEYQPKPLV